MRSTQQASQNFVINFIFGIYMVGALCYAGWYLWVYWASGESIMGTVLYGLVRSLIWPIWLFLAFAGDAAFS